MTCTRTISMPVPSAALVHRSSNFLLIPVVVDLKRKRAKEHLGRMKLEVAKRVAILNRDGVVRQIDPQTGDHIWVVNAPGTTTDRTSVLAGDFIHNLRSLLDHIVFSLDPKPERRPLPEWPIYQNAGPGDDGFYPAGIMKIWSLPVAAKVIVEGLQPYNGGNEPLLHIRNLDNIDKHRRLLTTRFKHGDVIGRAAPTNDMTQVEQMNLHPRFQITIDEPGISGEIISEFSKLYEFVEKVVLPKFKPLF